MCFIFFFMCTFYKLQACVIPISSARFTKTGVHFIKHAHKIQDTCAFKKINKHPCHSPRPVKISCSDVFKIYSTRHYIY